MDNERRIEHLELALGDAIGWAEAYGHKQLARRFRRFAEYETILKKPQSEKHDIP